MIPMSRLKKTIHERYGQTVYTYCGNRTIMVASLRYYFRKYGDLDRATAEARASWCRARGDFEQAERILRDLPPLKDTP